MKKSEENKYCYKCATNLTFVATNALQISLLDCYKFCNFAAVTQTGFIMVQIISRGSKEGEVNLYVRVFKRNVINNAVTLGISLPLSDWHYMEQILKNAAEAEKTGNIVTLRDTLAMNLWNLKSGLELMLDDDGITVQSVREYVKSILKKDAVKELERQKEEAAKVEEESKRMTLMQWIAEFIRQCETGERLKRKSTKMITPGTIKSYKGTQEQLKEYQIKSHKKIDFDDVTLDFYESWKQFFVKKKYSPNTIGRHVRNLKIFLFAADDMKLTTSQEFKSSRFSADREDVDNVYLTEERLQQMYEFNPTDKKQVEALIERAAEADKAKLREQTEKVTSRKLLEEAKDVFVVGCLIGQRVSDYKRVSKDMIVTLRDGKKYVCLVQEKTGKEVFLPYDERLEAILKKYGGKLPKVYDQHLNERIKIVGHLLGWTELAGIMERKGAMEVMSKKKFYECIKTHTARRTFATNAYKNGVSLSSIMAVTGHSSEQMLRKYLKLDNKERAILAAAEFERVKKAM